MQSASLRSKIQFFSNLFLEIILSVWFMRPLAAGKSGEELIICLMNGNKTETNIPTLMMKNKKSVDDMCYNYAKKYKVNLVTRECIIPAIFTSPEILDIYIYVLAVSVDRIHVCV